MTEKKTRDLAAQLPTPTPTGAALCIESTVGCGEWGEGGLDTLYHTQPDMARPAIANDIDISLEKHMLEGGGCVVRVLSCNQAT